MIGRPVKDLTGQRFGRLIVVGRAPNAGPSGEYIMWLCRCDCGNEKTLQRSAIKSGGTMSCGCLMRERASARGKAKAGIPLTHGHTTRCSDGRLTYTVWMAMRQRCSNPNNNKYEYYGGRGIRVCERWESFENFLADMGERPSRRHTIDRFPDGNGNYEPLGHSA